MFQIFVLLYVSYQEQANNIDLFFKKIFFLEYIFHIFPFYISCYYFQVSKMFSGNLKVMPMAKVFCYR